MLVILLYAFVHLNQIGLPDFAKTPLLEQLRSHGFELDFSRMRLRLGRGIVVEHVNLRRTGEVAGEQVFCTQLQLKLRWSDLISVEIPTITAVTLHGGRFTLPLQPDPQQAPFVVAVEGVEALLRFDSDTHWILDALEATSHGGRFQAAGDIVLKTRSSRAAKTESDDAWKRLVVQAGRTLDATRFRGVPSLELNFHADLANPSSSTGHLRLNADGVRSGSVSADALTLEATLQTPVGIPGTSNLLMNVGVQMDATGIHSTDWSAAIVRGSAEIEAFEGQSFPRRVKWRVSATQPSTRWVTAEQTFLTGEFSGNPVADSEAFTAKVAVKANRLVHPWGSSASVNIDADASRPGTGDAVKPGITTFTWHAVADRAKGFDGEIARIDFSGHSHPDPTVRLRSLTLDPAQWSLDSALNVSNAVFPKLRMDQGTALVRWQEGVLSVSNLVARAYDGRVSADASVDAASRVATIRVESALDFHALAPLFGAGAESWLEQISWPHDAPPVVSVEATARMPAWTNRAPDWKAEVMPTLHLAGMARLTNVSYRGVQVSEGVVPFHHTNDVWTVVGAKILRPEGTAELDFTQWTETRDYYVRLKSGVDPTSIAPLFGATVARAVTNNASFTEPPQVEAEIWGRWREPERTGVLARIEARRFNTRGQSVDEFRAARVGFTNGWLRIEDALVRQGTGTAIVPQFAYDIPGRRLYFTNALSTLSPRNVTRAIGPKTARSLEPFEFATPPTVVINGVIPTQDSLDDADVRFETRADHLHWWRLTATNLAATVWWRGQGLIVTNLDTGFHGGRMTGNLAVDFSGPADTVFRFDSVLSEVQLRSLLNDVAPSTNRIDGIIGGRLTVKEAHSRTNGPWTGSGVARLRDGFLWDLPLFGGLSAALDHIAPGIAQSRFNSGSGTFTITNRVIQSHDLEFRSSSMRLLATGTVDFDTRLDATMRAELLRDVPLLGPLVSFALSPVTKLFEYNVRGTLGKPVTSMSHVPEVFMAPLRPIQTIKSILPGEAEKPANPDPATRTPPSTTPSTPAKSPEN